jgi:hypothetical protein
MTIARQIALLRARYAAQKAPERARGYLMASGLSWRLAGLFVLTHRTRKGKTLT